LSHKLVEHAFDKLKREFHSPIAWIVCGAAVIAAFVLRARE